MMTKPANAHVRIIEDTILAFSHAQQAATSLADLLAAGSSEGWHAVHKAEAELDRLDREIDSLITDAIVGCAPEQVRELLSSMKMVIDLERIADLFASVAGCAAALGTSISVDDVRDLVKMASVVEKMLADAAGGYAVRNLDRAVAVIQADVEVDRLRSLVLIRHVEQTTSSSTHHSMQVLFMAQAIERAGDHVKNLAEEVCHLATGKSLRHATQGSRKSGEQMYLNCRRKHHALDAVLNVPLV